MFEKIKLENLYRRVNLLQDEKKDILKKEDVLSEVENPTLLQKEVLKSSQDFDLLSFFQDKLGDTAIGLITPLQSFLFDCNLVESDIHGYNFQALYDALYSGKINILFMDDDLSWQNHVMEDGNIALQLSSVGDIYLWIPEKIQMYQYQQLQEFYKRLLEVILSNNNLFFDVCIVVRSSDGKEIFVDSTLGSFLDSYDEEKQIFCIPKTHIHHK